ncbi:MAG TPA: HD domain-containing protein [Bacteroidales bacterium]|nr:HD domain-containing protein [Bacteroidales bacterium]
MDKERIIVKVEEYVRSYHATAEAGHNWWHIERVRNNAMYIYRYEKSGDPFIIELAALLHDIGDHKIDSEADGKGLVSELLGRLGVEDSITKHVTGIMKEISFRDSYGAAVSKSPGLMIVQDADRLDAIGAVGIARAFSYGGSKGNEIWVPGLEPSHFNSKEEYAGTKTTTINHFYEKLLLLKDRMNTVTGSALAKERHEFMERFLDQFFRECNLGKND